MHFVLLYRVGRSEWHIFGDGYCSARIASVTDWFVYDHQLIMVGMMWLPALAVA